jgi:hypothetical protein
LLNTPKLGIASVRTAAVWGGGGGGGNLRDGRSRSAVISGQSEYETHTAKSGAALHDRDDDMRVLYSTVQLETRRDAEGSKNSFTEKWVICMVLFHSVLKTCFFPLFFGEGSLLAPSSHCCTVPHSPFGRPIIRSDRPRLSAPTVLRSLARKCSFINGGLCAPFQVRDVSSQGKKVDDISFYS